MHADNNVTLTIIMPVFNHPDDVATMIDSIRANDYQDWELLAVDDGSDNDTLALLNAYSADDRRIIVVRRDIQPKGAQTCRNIGLDMARGEYCVVFDSDDYIAPYCLRQRVEAMEKHEELDFMVFPSGVFVDGEFKTQAHPYDFGYRLGQSDVESFARRRLPFIVWNNIYRTKALRRCNLRWNNRLLSLQDADFNICAIAAGLKYDYARALPDYGYRIITTASISKKINTERHVQSHCHANDRMWAMVRQIAGHKYDSALYDGTMAIYNSGMSGGGINPNLAAGLANSVAKYSRWYGGMLRAQMAATILLQKVLPLRVARQLPVVVYLLRNAWWRRHKVAVLQKYISKK